MKEKIVDGLRDTGKALLIGLAIAGAAFGLFFLVGLFLNSFQIRAALTLARSGLFFVGAFALFILAGLLMKKKKGEGVRGKKTWKRHFKVFGLTPVLMAVAVVILAAAIILDYGLYYS
ncbi:MAG: hypothetical protein Q4F41_15475 [Eubacteriales bacterium]|nr:hypothetical protein [Eubacteriales bacterium]